MVFFKGTGRNALEAKVNSATLKITNGGTGSAVLKSVTVVGRKITDYGRMEAQALDLVSASLYGRRQMRLNLPSVDNLKYAELIADYELARRKDPPGTVKSITLRSHAIKVQDITRSNLPAQLARWCSSAKRRLPTATNVTSSSVKHIACWMAVNCWKQRGISN